MLSAYQKKNYVFIVGTVKNKTKVEVIRFAYLGT